jgi:hypothetical protein
MKAAPPFRLYAVSTSVLAFGAASCLPADTRPPPATIELFVSPNDGTQTGFTTTDGWNITVERFLVGIGEASAGDNCISYSDAGYTRLLDGKRTDDQKLALLFALGQCEMRLRLQGPDSGTIVGAGVSDVDALLQGLKGVDPYVSQPSSVSVGLTATATRGADAERLNWSFRQTIRYGTCETPVNGIPAQPLDFSSNAGLAYHIVLHPEALWSDDARPTAALRFDSIASADTLFGNSDGEITLDELAGVSLVEARKTGPYGIGDNDPATIPTLNSLEDYVYQVLVRNIPQFREPVLCKVRPRNMFD